MPPTCTCACLLACSAEQPASPRTGPANLPSLPAHQPALPACPALQRWCGSACTTSGGRCRWWRGSPWRWRSADVAGSWPQQQQPPPPHLQHQAGGRRCQAASCGPPTLLMWLPTSLPADSPASCLWLLPSLRPAANAQFTLGRFGHRGRVRVRLCGARAGRRAGSVYHCSAGHGVPHTL